MSWNGNQFNRPLIMVQWVDIKTLQQKRGYEPPEDVLELFPSEHISAELALSILLHNGKVEDAVNLLACVIAPRVGVWWACLCLQSVLKDVAADFAKDGLTPRERRKKEMSALADKLSDTSDIDAMVEEQKKLIDEQVKKLEEAAREQKYLNPAERLQLKMAWIKREFEAFRNSLPPGTLGDENGPLLMEETLDSILTSAKKDFDHIAAAMSPEPPPMDIPSSERIFDAIRQKTEAIQPAIDKEMGKHFPLKLKGLPTLPSPARKQAAVMAALRWVLAPSDDNGKLACEAAIAAKQGPEAMLAYAAFWSSTNLKTETGIAPTNPALPPMGISKTLLQLALMEGGEKDYDARYEEFFRIGIDCADGSLTWDEEGNEVRLDATAESPQVTEERTIWSRSGFGRK